MSKLLHWLIGFLPKSLGFLADRGSAHISAYFPGEASRDRTGVDSASSSWDFVSLNCCRACA